MREEEKSLRSYFLSSMEAIENLKITRQRLNSLAKKGKITRIKKNGVTLYYREEIDERKKEQEKLRKKYRPYDYDS